jgi:hypothetical protein
VATQEYDIRGLDSFLVFTITIKTIMNNQGSGNIPFFFINVRSWCSSIIGQWKY